MTERTSIPRRHAVYLSEGRIITSASDLKAASECEFAFARVLDAKLGRIAAATATEDPMLARTGRLGDAHELRVLERYRARFGNGVAEIERPDLRDSASLTAAVDATIAAFRRGADVVFQGAFAAEGFVGFADFIVRQPDGRYRVQDTKLARSARVTALLQLAAYAEQLGSIGVPVDDTVELLLGDGSESAHRLIDIEPVFRLRRARLDALIADRLAAAEPLEWRAAGYAACGRCDECAAQVEASRDVLLTAGLRLVQRDRLRAAGITTIDQLAASAGAVEGIPDATLQGLREQARLQVQGPAADGAPRVEVHNPPALAAIPRPDPGDVFFDFEGDPLYTEGDGGHWGLDYLFGLVEPDGTFRAWWAHDFAEERAALIDFLDWIERRRERWPDMHIHHYASYERSHLQALAARHGVGEEQVDRLLRESVLVDLYPIVRKAVRVGSRSYSLKKLEPLYMGDELRSGEVTTAGDSIEEYVRAREAIALGDVAAGQRMLDAIADYNAYDCRSTLRLRDWLLQAARDAGIEPVYPRGDEPLPPIEPSPVALALLARAGDPHTATRTADETAAALGAAAIDYHRREHKSFWWGHFARLIEPVDSWAQTRDVLVIDSATVERDWHREGGQRADRRHLRLHGEWGPGSRTAADDRPFLLYEHPSPYPATSSDPGARVARSVRVLDVAEDSVLIEETLPVGVDRHGITPSAIAPAPPPDPGDQPAAIEEWAAAQVAATPDWRPDPASDVLRRLAPRTRSGALAPVRDGDTVAAVVASALDLDASYLAVQGPPGTGKTYLASHVIARLVQHHGWKVGVVAQSHAVVENVLRAVVRAGVPVQRVGKTAKRNEAQGGAGGFTQLEPNGHLSFATEHAASGFVLGGTAWDFSKPARVPRGSLDLLVIDEAGQFSLASTIAAAVAARNLLLLGDPQQLPQVSQGTHPEPVDTSALGWLTDGHDVLPAEFGYFLAESRRMHPAVADPVSHLSYEGELHAHPTASQRALEGIEPGLVAVPVHHAGNATESTEEAAAVVDLARAMLGRSWRASADAAPRPLAPSDVIVVTPYNAQLALVREALDRAGLAGVRAGTVDKFQGQEAVIAIVTLAASDARSAPRGLDFLLMKNRLNVAISRAQWAGRLVYSPGLLDALPRTPAGVAQLSAFARLVGVAPAPDSKRPLGSVE